MNDTINRVIQVAKNEVGYIEKSEESYMRKPSILDQKKSGAGRDNYTKYGRDMHEIFPEIMDFPASWCDCFVDWCFYKAYGVNNAKKLLCGNFEDTTALSAKLFKDSNAWYENNPMVGDQVFFKNEQGICHTGLVIEVTDDKITTIEGNTSNKEGLIFEDVCVREKTYPIDSDLIAGYGRPNYSLLVTHKK